MATQKNESLILKGKFVSQFSTPSFVVVVLLFFLSPAQAQFSYVSNNGTIAITGYTGSVGNVIVPNTINGLPVTTIRNSAFAQNQTITNLIIPNSVTDIWSTAVNRCTNLVSVSLPDRIAYISPEVFGGCSSLTTVTIPSKVASIRDYAFVNCKKLSSITLPNSLRSIDLAVFLGCVSLTNITIPDNVVTIGTQAFQQCSNLTTAILGNSLTTIGPRAFDGCTSLTSIVIPRKVTTIKTKTFSNCRNLVSVTIPSTVTNIADYAFEGCSSLGIHFMGDPPRLGVSVFSGDAVVYYLPGALDWGTTFGGRPTSIWHSPSPVVLVSPPIFGVQGNAFNFRVSWATNLTVVVEGCSDPGQANWLPKATNTLVNGYFDFRDPDWPNSFAQFYRVRSL